MPITVVCNCGTRFDVPDNYVGRTGNCTSCGAPMVVRAPSDSGRVHGSGSGVTLQRPSGSGPVPPGRGPSGSGEHPPAGRGPSGSGEHPPAGGGTATVGRKLGNYELQTKLGSEKSSVFLANSPGGQVAIKVLPQEVAKKSPTAGKRFLREARSMFGKDHPNIIKTVDAGEELGTYYLVMEHFDGRTLESLLHEEGGTISEQEALGYGLEVAKGVAFLQAQGLVHRNIKPIHIMVRQDQVKLVGMGLVRQTESEGSAQVTGAGMIVGTPEYMSPEQAMSGDIDSRSDLYALGTTIYRMLAGQTPFHHKIPSRVVAALVRQPAPSIQKARPEVSNATAAVIERLLQKDRGDRYSTATDLIADIEAIQAGRLVAGLPPGFAQRAAGAAKPGGDSDDSVKKLVIVVGVLIVVVVILLVVVLVMALGGG